MLVRWIILLIIVVIAITGTFLSAMEIRGKWRYVLLVVVFFGILASGILGNFVWKHVEGFLPDFLVAEGTLESVAASTASTVEGTEKNLEEKKTS